ncbi:DUF769 domain-containing protein [Roseateles sp. YR242]|uniref:DUF769 domain-containing protein n=1 Tax=Roseateles sp. YR242 TaxID=1855305 RepID=UPI000B855D01|nr:DUF769 domain-containing protein [Roseateles sp. YR242]
MISKNFVWLLMAFVLAACAAGEGGLDSRLGKPYPEFPTSPRELSLKYYVVNLFDRYRISHAYLGGVNISECYAGANPNRLLKYRFPTPVKALSRGASPLGGH